MSIPTAITLRLLTAAICRFCCRSRGRERQVGPWRWDGAL